MSIQSVTSGALQSATASSQAQPKSATSTSNGTANSSVSKAKLADSVSISSAGWEALHNSAAEEATETAAQAAQESRLGEQ